MKEGTESRPPVVVATWPFGLPASQAAWRVLKAKGSALDAAVQGATFCEDDESVDSVGYGGLPDASGEVTLDASVMDHRAQCGSVACLRRVRRAAQVARAVMERTPHVMLVGEAATAFAVSQGFAETDLLSPRAADAYARWRGGRAGGAAPSPVAAPYSGNAAQTGGNAPRSPAGEGAHGSANRTGENSADRSHDTIGILALDGSGVPAGACTTSGRAYKLPGRVGDSPIIGAGLYVDGKVGAVTATGLGEEVIRVCGSFAVIDLMRRGAEPAEALAEVLHRVETNRPDVDVSFLALRRDGAWAGMTLRAETDFRFAVVDEAGGRLVKGAVLKAR